MCKEDLALNNLQWLLCHKIQSNQIVYIWYIRGAYNKFPDFFRKIVVDAWPTFIISGSNQRVQ